MIRIDTLKRLFEVPSEQSKITFKGKCFDCKCDVTIGITSTSRGYGLQGGFLFEPSSDWYFAKCPDCYKVNPILGARYKNKYKCKIVTKKSLILIIL